MRSEARKLFGKGGSVSGNVDGYQDTATITNLFAKKYDDLYNSVSYNMEDMSAMFRDLDSRISCICCRDLCNGSHNISISEVANAVMGLKTK